MPYRENKKRSAALHVNFNYGSFTDFWNSYFDDIRGDA